MFGNDIWCITSYYNPNRYQSRLNNYGIFRKHLDVPLCVVEHSIDGTFELANEDADQYLRITSRDVLWQKERLLNLALQRLPQEAQIVVWVDCDVVFLNPNWHADLRAVMNKVPIAQCYSELFDLQQGELIDSVEGSRLPTGRSSLSFASYETAGEQNRSTGSAGLSRPGSMGGAWAARREIVERVGFYDAMVVGGGDRPFAYACLGWFDDAIKAAQMNAAQAAHFEPWARRIHSAVAGRMGVVPGVLAHLWHGSMENRQYWSRHGRLAGLDFDPSRDIQIGPSGAWEWTSVASSDLKDFVANYFHSRREDGEPLAERR